MEIVLRILDITFPIFSIVALGLYCGYTFSPDMRVANRLNMDVFIPALVFSVIIGQSVDVRDYLPLILAALLVVLGSGLLIWPVAHLLKIELKTLAPPMMFNNAGNMGLPLMVLTFGEQALPIAMILFLVENTLHFTLGMAWLNNSQDSQKEEENKKTSSLRSMISPLTIASFIAIGLGMTEFKIHPTLMLPIDMVGQIVIPMMLFSLGVRLSRSSLKTLPIGLIGGIACPLSGLMMVIIVMPFFDLSPMQAGGLFLFGALPPAILNFMFAERYNQEPDKVASIVIVGNALTLITLPLVLSYVIPRFT
ncbi:MAG: putative permease [Cellvibrionaceae bacterium]|jgi:predicted permease